VKNVLKPHHLGQEMQITFTLLVRTRLAALTERLPISKEADRLFLPSLI
jgi:hypothetical protein